MMLLVQKTCLIQNVQCFSQSNKYLQGFWKNKRVQINRLRALEVNFAKDQLDIQREDYLDAKQKIKEEGDQEYAQLRKNIIRNTQRVGGALTLYIYLVFNATAAFCCMAGGIGSYLYVLLLVNDVDSLKQEDIQWWINIDKMRQSPTRSVIRALSSYKISLKPRLLIPGVLAAGAWIYNQYNEVPLSIVDEAALLVGFLSYKGSLISRLWQELKPRVEEIKAGRPSLRDNEEDKYDIYGNLKETFKNQ
eukprot:TRINITY_DN363_c0_g1_i2.p1 TRINITY_DN363_c0_g1~~TRINITY_DN363_c0_g1_i2.p1  ORF type:complete len:248 (-),score=30.57 TRINITY_DN363_c0_g1_i2:452-1195(-)